MRRTTLLLLTLLLVGLGFEGLAQVTTSSMSGVVKNDKGEALVGATITLKHIPTGASFNVSTRNGGVFDINNIPPGGPYSVKVSYIGFSDYTKEDINIPLGERYDLQTTLLPSNSELQVVTVTAARRGATEKTGASTNISNRLIQNLPNVTRSLANLTRITPQSNGNSFAGMNNRYNNLTIDGSLFNNNFGRGGDGMIPGGAVSAISIDAIDQVQVNIAPFDVRQAGFVGSGINAVTRRGTNNMYATVYGFYRNQEFTGKKVLDRKVDNPKRSNKTFGASVGGPIIKDKLFFFVNYEMENRTQPGQTFVSKKSADDKNPNATSVLESDLKLVSDYLVNNFKFNPGKYEGYDFDTDNKKLLARLDWNISSRHRLTLRYTQSETNDDDQVNAASTTGLTADRINNSRRGGKTGGMAFNSSNFKNNVKVWSGVAELNSNFSNTFSNQLIASYTDNELERVPNSNMPFVDIMNKSDKTQVYISFGTDLFSYKNSISDKALNIADNLTINLGRHTLTAGVSYEYMKFANSFTGAGGPAYYRYSSVDAFIAGDDPIHFAVAFDPNNRLGIKVPEAKFAQLGVYLQDAWTVSNKFKLTYGVRLDKPFYPYDPPKNPALEARSFKDVDGNIEHFDVSKWPKSRILVSPRVGFVYDVDGDKKTIVRGGTGLFTGRIPFIWMVNQVGDNGIVRALFQTKTPAGYDYNADRTTYIPANPDPVGTSILSGSSFSAIDKNFKMPQVWRTNLAVDRKFGGNYTFTLEALYTKFINNPFFRNANLADQSGVINGIDKRPYYNNPVNNSANLNTDINQMAVLDNTNKGYSLALTAGVQKSFSNNWEAGIAYTYTLAQEVSIGSSDQSGSGWTTNNIARNPNIPELGQSNFSVPHRIVANGSYRVEYGSQKKLATTIGLFYSAAPQERYSFRYSSNINGDGASNDILYIPKDASEIKFVEGFKNSNGNTYSAAQQSEAFFKFIESDKYLRKHKGQTMEKYGALLPWFHSLDMRILQDFRFKTGEKKHTIQFSIDVINLLNLVNKDWGYRYQYTFGTFQDMGIVGIASSSNNTGKLVYSQANPLFTFDPEAPKKAYQPAYNTGSTWGIQLGLRYIFN
ncbi:TonB-dependent receptor [Pseudoflavitalea sp. G-6-1-2]|uniref:TonB-dependent receptor n=1 Tax=Pseudoflavitalea sp. G-6-1-2 TaxID=2728841 RepID=UPI00146DDE65|nr:carboxypeptidase regulatory-like domain-containing protein [Pseudoflavitalea sp. G-6-1-2]NML22132.1 TonB-dependent receptor [Pseudoflavitalea sp. G-6-1-2]